MLVMPIIIALFLLANASNTSADHGGGTSGGCSGDCTPPTLGIDNAGRQIVKGGFTINGNAFDVNHFRQTIPTQVIKVNDPVTVTLTMFENTSPKSLKHVGFMMGLEYKVIGGVRVQAHDVQIHWERGLDGNPSVVIDDPEGLTRDVSVTETVEGINNVITVEFTPTQVFDVGTVTVQMWDVRKNLWRNYFDDSMKIVPSVEASSSGGTIPEWVKHNAGWWADGKIDDGQFVQAMQYLIRNGIIDIPSAAQGAESGPVEIPEWVKHNAGWWADGKIDDGQFVQAMQYLMTIGVISV